jgi:hypothetical protein
MQSPKLSSCDSSSPPKAHRFSLSTRAKRRVYAFFASANRMHGCLAPLRMTLWTSTTHDTNFVAQAPVSPRSCAAGIRSRLVLRTGQ